MSLVFQDDGCSRFVSSQYLSTLLTSHALFGDSKKKMFSVLWTDSEILQLEQSSS